MIDTRNMYQVWSSRGHGFHGGPRFRLLQDALRYVSDHSAQESLAVRCPDGHWYQFRWGAHHVERLHNAVTHHRSRQPAAKK